MFLYWSNWENVFKYNKKTKHLSQILAKNLCSFSFSHVPSLIFLAKIFFPCRHQWSHGTGGLVFFQVALQESPSFTWRLCFCFLAPEQLFCCLLIEKRRVYVQIREPSPSPADGRHVECVSMPPPERSLAHRSLRLTSQVHEKAALMIGTGCDCRITTSTLSLFILFEARIILFYWHRTQQICS